MTTQLAKMEEALKTYYAWRRQVDELSQEPRHNSFFSQGKWHRCACPECKQGEDIDRTLQPDAAAPQGNPGDIGE